MIPVLAPGSILGLIRRCAPVYYQGFQYVVTEDPRELEPGRWLCWLGDQEDAVRCDEIGLDLGHPVGALFAERWCVEREHCVEFLKNTRWLTARQRACVLRYCLSVVGPFRLAGLLSDWTPSPGMDLCRFEVRLPPRRFKAEVQPVPIGGLLTFDRGWIAAPPREEYRSGLETGDAGKAKLNEIFLGLGYATLDGDDVVFPDV